MWPTIAKGLTQDWKVNVSNGSYSTPKILSIGRHWDRLFFREMSASSYKDKENERTTPGTLGVYLREVSAFLRVNEND